MNFQDPAPASVFDASGDQRIDAPEQTIASTFSINKEAVRKLPDSVKSQLRGSLSDWAILDNTQAKHFRSGEGIQFFEQDGQRYRKASRPTANSSTTLCCVTTGWVQRQNQARQKQTGSAFTSASQAQIERHQPEIAPPKQTVAGATSAEPSQTNHNLHLSILNPDGNPMPDARYEVQIEGQTFTGKISVEGETDVTFLPAGEATVTILPKDDELPALRQQVKAGLDGLVAEAMERKIMLDDLLFQDGFGNGALIIGVIWAKAVFDRGVDLTKDTIEMVKGVPDAVSSAKSALYQAMQDADHDGIRDGYAFLVNAAGEAKADIERLAAVTSALIDDTEFWSMISAFPARYYDSMSAEDQAKLFGAASFDLAACFIAAAALAKASTAVTTLRSSAGLGAILAASPRFVPLVDAIKRIAHIHELKRYPLVKKVSITKHEQKLELKQNARTEALPEKPVVHDTNAAKTDTDKASECASQTCKSGEPISMVTGEELFEATDFHLPGPVPLAWKRTYRSTASGTRSELGFGWSHPWAVHLRIDADTIWLRTEEGISVPFSLPEHGATHRHVIGSSISRFHDDFTVLHNGQTFFFTPDPMRPEHMRLAQVSNDSKTAFWTLHYHDTTGRLESASNSWGGILHFHWNDHGLRSIVSEEVATGTKTPLVRYRVNAEGDLFAAKRHGFPTEQYRYTNHLFALRQTESGARYRFEWDELTPNARCTRQASEDGHYNYQFNWDYRGEDCPQEDRVAYWNKTTDSNGVVELFGYDEHALLLCHVQGDGGTEYFYYNDLQQLTKHLNTEGQSTHYRYDEHQRVVHQTDIGGQSTSIRYWRNTHLPERVTNHLGQTLHFAYDEQDRLIHKTFADGKQETYHYAFGRLARKVDPLGQEHRFTWHEHWGTLARYECYLGLPAESRLQQSVDFMYDDNGRLISQCDHLGNEQHFRYNDRGQLTTKTNQYGAAEHFRYDALGRVVAQTDTAGRTTQFHYGNFAQLEAKTLPDGNQIQFEYDRERNLTALINPNGAMHRFEYDACERIKKETTVDGRTTEYHYNTLGHLTGLTDGRIHATFQRDTYGKLLSEVYSDPDRPNADVFNSFVYDELGQLIRAGNAQADVEFKYNSQGQLIQESSTHTFKGAFGKLDAHRHESHFQYTGQGQLQALHHKAFKPETPDMQFGFVHRGTYRMRRTSWHEQYHWHDNGTLAAIRVGNDQGEHTLLRQQTNDLGQITERQQGQHTLAYGYDAERRLQQVTRLNQRARSGEAVVQERSYQYDNAGRLSQLNDSLTGTLHYHYNAVDALTQVNDTPFTSDSVGNRLPEGLDQLLDNRLPFWGDRHYEYDDWGNIVTIKRGQGKALVQALSYNAKHQLIELVETHHGEFKQKLTFAYDALGRRLRKEVFTDATTPNYDYAEHTVWRGQHAIQTRTFGRNKRCLHDQAVVYQPGSHTPLALLDSDHGLLDIDTDHLGTPKALFDHHTGTELWRTDHDLYGALKNEHTTNGRLHVNLRFQGQSEDRETGLYYNFNRYYDPQAGRYINHDPIGLMGGLNQYQYCPNPVQWVDPLGLICKEHVETKSMAKLEELGYSGVRVTENGGLDYSNSNALYSNEGVNPIIKIEYSGDYLTDFESASRQALGQKSTPKGYVWHHLDDYDPVTNTGTMQLVEAPAHRGILHNGGVSQYKAATDNSYIFKSW